MQVFQNGGHFLLDFPIRKTEKTVKLGIRWLRLVFVFLGGWFYFLAKFSWGQFWGRKREKYL